MKYMVHAFRCLVTVTLLQHDRLAVASECSSISQFVLFRSVGRTITGSDVLSSKARRHVTSLKDCRFFFNWLSSKECLKSVKCELLITYRGKYIININCKRNFKFMLDINSWLPCTTSKALSLFTTLYKGHCQYKKAHVMMP